MTLGSATSLGHAVQKLSLDSFLQPQSLILPSILALIALDLVGKNELICQNEELCILGLVGLSIETSNLEWCSARRVSQEGEPRLGKGGGRRVGQENFSEGRWKKSWGGKDIEGEVYEWKWEMRKMAPRNCWFWMLLICFSSSMQCYMLILSSSLYTSPYVSVFIHTNIISQIFF